MKYDEISAVCDGSENSILSGICPSDAAKAGVAFVTLAAIAQLVSLKFINDGKNA